MSTGGKVLIFIALAALIDHASADPTVAGTTVLGPFTGHDAKLHPGNLVPDRK